MASRTIQYNYILVVGLLRLQTIVVSGAHYLHLISAVGIAHHRHVNWCLSTVLVRFVMWHGLHSNYAHIDDCMAAVYGH